MKFIHLPSLENQLDFPHKNHESNYDSFYKFPRTLCTSGSRHFFIMPNGDIAKCAGYYYGYNNIKYNWRNYI